MTRIRLTFAATTLLALGMAGSALAAAPAQAAVSNAGSAIAVHAAKADFPVPKGWRPAGHGLRLANGCRIDFARDHQGFYWAMTERQGDKHRFFSHWYGPKDPKKYDTNLDARTAAG